MLNTVQIQHGGASCKAKVTIGKTGVVVLQSVHPITIGIGGKHHNVSFTVVAPDLQTAKTWAEEGLQKFAQDGPKTVKIDKGPTEHSGKYSYQIHVATKPVLFYMRATNPVS